MRFFIDITFDGSAYCGWQKQLNGIAVQEVLEQKLSTIFRKPTNIYGAGRTDTGVHAKQMIAHFDTDHMVDPKNLKSNLNRFLPKDIAINNIRKVKEDSHARFSPIERTYHYKITWVKNPFHTKTHWFNPNFQPELNKLNDCSQVLLDYSDFASFARSNAAHKTTICNVTKVNWTKKEHEYLFEISANRFLRNMVRAIVGTLVEVGQNKIDANRFIEIIEQKDRKFASSSAPALGLYLQKIVYPSDIYE